MVGTLLSYCKDSGITTDLQCVCQHSPWSHRHPEPLHRIVEGLHHMRGGLKDIRPDLVHEVSEGIFTAKAVDPQGHVLHSPAGSLAMDKVPVREEE